MMNEGIIAILFIGSLILITILAFVVGYHIGRIRATHDFTKHIEKQKHDMLQHIIGTLQNPFIPTQQVNPGKVDINSLIDWYEKEIQRAIDHDAFEEAAELRDQLNKIKGNGKDT